MHAAYRFGKLTNRGWGTMSEIDAIVDIAGNERVERFVATAVARVASAVSAARLGAALTRAAAHDKPRRGDGGAPATINRITVSRSSAG